MTLAREKALSLAQAGNCVIGGDQVAALENSDGTFEILSKPGTFEKATAQLLKMQGRTHRLYTALCIIYHGKQLPILDVTTIKMRPLLRAEIESYVHTDQPLDCAGSYKIEKAGILLVDEMECKDFSAIQGVPLIQLTKTLIELGYKIPATKEVS